MTRNFLREPSSGQVAHSSISAAFIKNPSLNDWALFMTSTSAMMASQTVEATERYGVTESKTQTAYNVWKHTDRSFFDEIKESKELTRQFASYMKNVTSGKGLSIRHLVTGYDWSSLGEATVVDVCRNFTRILQHLSRRRYLLTNSLAWRIQRSRQYRPGQSLSKPQVHCPRPAYHDRDFSPRHDHPTALNRRSSYLPAP